MYGERRDPGTQTQACEIVSTRAASSVVGWFISLAGLVTPSLRNFLMHTLKEDFKSLQVVAVVRKVFLLHHDTYISTPTGEFPRLLMKLFQLDRLFTNMCNTLFPALMKLTVAGLIFLIMFPGLTGSLGFSCACIHVLITLVPIHCIHSSFCHRVAKQRSGHLSGIVFQLVTTRLSL